MNPLFQKKTGSVAEQLTQAGLCFPKSLKLAITNECNLHCHHCWPESRWHKKSSFVKKSILNRLIDEFSAFGGTDLIITGGEPLTHPQWLEVTAGACKHTGIKSVCLQTNGILLTADIVKTLESKAFNKLTLQVSIDGATAKTNDHVRGAGSFDPMMQSLTRLSNSLLKKRTTLAFTEMKHNFEEIPFLFKTMDNIGFSHIMTSTFVQKGRACTANAVSSPTSAQYKKLLDDFHRNQAFNKRYLKMGNIAAIEWFKGKETSFHGGCNLISHPYITADGRMHPCTMLEGEDFAVHHLHRRPFEDALLEGIPIWSELQKKSRKRRLVLEECTRCDGRLHCAGGCMGRAYLSHGKTDSIEDRCVLRKAVYNWKLEYQLR
ncbi:MAG: radical SAM protein [Desulfatitalea sp.]|nr:radical SAM protein [Desulfatitalea sp.]